MGWLIAFVVVAIVLAFVAWVAVKAGRAAGEVGKKLLEEKDRNAGILHNPVSPTLTADKNFKIWTYGVAGKNSEIKTVRVGPIHPDIDTTGISVNYGGWSGQRTGQWVEWHGPKLPEGQTLDLSFQTTADPIEGSGALQAVVYVSVLKSTAGDRTKSGLTLIPTKP